LQPLFLAHSGGRENPPNEVNPQISPIERAQDAATALELKNPVERRLLQGETHSYHIRIDGGQYLRIAVERSGADLMLVIRDTKGMIRTNLTCRSDSPMPV
jgi:hypothetical protein